MASLTQAAYSWCCCRHSPAVNSDRSLAWRRRRQSRRHASPHTRYPDWFSLASWMGISWHTDAGAPGLPVNGSFSWFPDAAQSSGSVIHVSLGSHTPFAKVFCKRTHAESVTPVGRASWGATGSLGRITYPVGKTSQDRLVFMAGVRHA